MLYLISRRYDKRNHRRAISSGFLQALDQFLDLPDLDILVGGGVFRHDSKPKNDTTSLYSVFISKTVKIFKY